MNDITFITFDSQKEYNLFKKMVSKYNSGHSDNQIDRISELGSYMFLHYIYN